MDCVAWREKAEFVCKYFAKGMPILVSGRLQMRKWEDRTGAKRVSAEIQAENVYFAGGERKRDSAAATPDWVTNAEKEDPYGGVWDDEEGELPF